MRNVYEALKEKRGAIEQLRREIEALRLVAPMLAEAGDAKGSIFVQPLKTGEAASEMAWNSSQQRESLTAQEPAKPKRIASDTKFAKAKKISRELRRITAPLLGASVT